MTNKYEELQEKYNDVPKLDDVEESLKDPETLKRVTFITLVNHYLKKLNRVNGVLMGLISFYILLIKFPVVIFDVGIRYVGEVFDPIIGFLLLLFGINWLIVGCLNAWGGWNFYRLRKLQNTDSSRPILHSIHSIMIIIVSLMILSLGSLYIYLII